MLKVGSKINSACCIHVNTDSRVVVSLVDVHNRVLLGNAIYSQLYETIVTHFKIGDSV